MNVGIIGYRVCVILPVCLNVSFISDYFRHQINCNYCLNFLSSTVTVRAWSLHILIYCTFAGECLVNRLSKLVFSLFHWHCTKNEQ